jgi:hypothetical protein
MPSFSPSTVSDQALDLIAIFVASLDGATPTPTTTPTPIPTPTPEEPVGPAPMEPTLALHHWAAIYVLRDGDAEDTLHHIGHILDVVTESEHMYQLEEAKRLINEGRLGEAQNKIREMLAGQADPGLTMARLYLNLALATLGQLDPQSAIHYMEHFISLVGEDDADEAGKVVKLIREGKLEDAEEEIRDEW